MTHDIGLLYLSELHVLTRSVHFISHNSTVLVFTATAFRLARRDCFVMLFNIYGLYVPRECWNNNIDMAETLTWLRMIVIMANVTRVKLDRTYGRSSSIRVTIHHTARTVSIYFCCKCQIPVPKKTF